MTLPHLPSVKEILKHRYTLMYGVPSFLILFTLTIFFFTRSTTQEKEIANLSSQKAYSETKLKTQNTDLQKKIEELQKRDEYKINQENAETIKQIQTTYKTSVTVYENLLKLKEKTPKLAGSFDILYAASLKQLADKNYTSASATLKELTVLIQKEEEKIIMVITEWEKEQLLEYDSEVRIILKKKGPG